MFVIREKSIYQTQKKLLESATKAGLDGVRTASKKLFYKRA